MEDDDVRLGELLDDMALEEGEGEPDEEYVEEAETRSPAMPQIPEETVFDASRFNPAGMKFL